MGAGLLGLATLVLVLGLFWAYFALVGVPTWLPDAGETPCTRYPGC